jgi:hypothetical protein
MVLLAVGGCAAGLPRPSSPYVPPRCLSEPSDLGSATETILSPVHGQYTILVGGYVTTRGDSPILSNFESKGLVPGKPSRQTGCRDRIVQVYSNHTEVDWCASVSVIADGPAEPMFFTGEIPADPDVYRLRVEVGGIIVGQFERTQFPVAKRLRRDFDRASLEISAPAGAVASLRQVFWRQRQVVALDTLEVSVDSHGPCWRPLDLHYADEFLLSTPFDGWEILLPW